MHTACPFRKQPVKNRKRLHTPQWKIISAVLAMIAGVSLVSALLAQFEIRQREQALSDALQEISELRERIQEYQERPAPAGLLPDLDIDEDALLGPVLDDEEDLNRLMEEIEGWLDE